MLDARSGLPGISRGIACLHLLCSYLGPFALMLFLLWICLGGLTVLLSGILTTDSLVLIIGAVSHTRKQNSS